MSLLQLSQSWFKLLQFFQIFITYANLKKTLPICPDVSNCSQVLMKLFQVPKCLALLEFAQIFLIVCKFNRSARILPNWNEVVWSSPKMNKANRSHPKLNEDVPLCPNLMELLPFGQTWFSLLEFTQICSNLWKHFQLHPNLNEAFLYCLNFIAIIKNLPKWFWCYPNLNKALVVHADISKCTKISIEQNHLEINQFKNSIFTKQKSLSKFHIAQLWTRLFEVAQNWMKLLQIAKLWFDWWISPNCFQFI